MSHATSSITERIITSHPELHLSVIHDQADGFTVANVALNTHPDNGTDLTLSELWELIDHLTTAATVLSEHSPVPYTVVA